MLGLGAAVALAAAGAAYAGGADCQHGKAAVAASRDHGEHGDHGQKGHTTGCVLSKNVTKTAKMTEDGAIVTLEGKTDEAVRMLKVHLEEHQESGEGCEGCPMGHEGVKASISLTEKGGTVTLTGSSADAIRTVQEWAKKPAGACCSGKEQKS